MRIIVCMKQMADGSFNPFDTSALECALQLMPDQITLLTMGRPEAASWLEELTRLGPVDAVLLSDMAFAGADTLATSYVLSCWLRRETYDLILCGRQSIDGETAQVGPELAAMLGLELVPRVMGAKTEGRHLICKTRTGHIRTGFPALLTVERAWDIRFPCLFAQKGKLQIMSAENLGADPARCGLMGSPTQVIRSCENTGGRRNCQMIAPRDICKIIRKALEKNEDGFCKIQNAEEKSEEKLPFLWITDPILETAAGRLAKQVYLVPLDLTENKTLSKEQLHSFAELVRRSNPPAVLFPSDWRSRYAASAVAALLETGLCADCTALSVEGGELHMIRPAFSGSLTAIIRCRTRPAMATVRTLESKEETLILSVGKGAVSCKKQILEWADRCQAAVTATRACVENGEFSYEEQVGLTGRNVSPKVYVALGISGAVHHIVGMECSGTVIAVNLDPEAPIFRYADYGICCDITEFCRHILSLTDTAEK